MVRLRRRVGKVRTVGRVDGEIAAEAEFSFVAAETLAPDADGEKADS